MFPEVLAGRLAGKLLFGVQGQPFTGWGRVLCSRGQNSLRSHPLGCQEPPPWGGAMTWNLLERHPEGWCPAHCREKRKRSHQNVWPPLLLKLTSCQPARAKCVTGRALKGGFEADQRALILLLAQSSLWAAHTSGLLTCFH